MNHDNSYKLLFSFPEMVRDLLTGFVQEDWVGQLDFSTLEKVSHSYVTDDLRDREDDLVWRVRWGDGWLYVYLLIEFQSRVEHHMAVRIMTYLGLLYQDLMRQKALTSKGRLPKLALAELEPMNELQEVHAVLAERVKKWHKRWGKEGLEKGMQKGMQQGMEKGQLVARRETARNLLLSTQLDDDTIASATSLSAAEVEAIRAEIRGASQSLGGH